MFADRYEAGSMLAFKILLQKITCDYILGITRGGVIVAHALSKHLGKPYKPFIVKKLSLPFSKELAIGAVTYEKIHTLDSYALQYFRLTPDVINKIINSQYSMLNTLQTTLGITKPKVKGKRILIVDDGVATGETVKVASLYCRKKGSKELILATPVIAKSVYKKLKPFFSIIITLLKPDDFVSVGQFYTSFNEVTVDDIKRIL